MNSPALSSSESIALLIDADNAPAGKVDFIIAELAKFGVVNIRRAYGNWMLARVVARKLSELFAAIDLFEMKQTKNGRVTTYWARDKKRTKTPAPSAPSS